MPNISASPSSAALTVAAKETEDNTHNLAELMELLRNEVRRLRLGDTSGGDEDVLR